MSHLLRPRRTGWRAYTYRGQHRARRHRVGHLASGLALLVAVHLA